MKNPILLGILIITLFVFGCLGGEGCETECPEGFKQLEDCTCVPIDDSINLKQGESTILDGWNVTIDKIIEEAKYDNETCLISDEKVRLILSKDNESRTITLEEAGMEKLTDNKTLVIEDINQIFNIEEQGCEVEDKEIVLNIISSDLSSRKESVSVTNTFEISSGTEIKVDSIDLTASYVDPYSDTYEYEEEEERDIEDLTVEIISITESTSIGDSSETTITKSEGSQASLPGDYTIKIIDITQTVDSPDTDVLTETYEEGNQVTLDENTNIQVYSIDIDTENCTNGCEVISEEVTLKVKPEGSRTTQTFSLAEGDSEFVSKRIRVQVMEINSDITCVEEECEIENKTVELRITTYNQECTLTDRDVELELLFPDLSTETFTLGYGDEKAFITGERVKVDSIIEDMEDSINGTCEIDNEKVTLTLTLLSNDCVSSNHRVQLKIYEGDEDYTVRLDEGDNQTTGTNNNIVVSVDEFDIDVEYDEDSEKCVINDEKVTLTIEVKEMCKESKDDIILSYGNSKKNLMVGDSAEIEGVRIELEDLEGDIKIEGEKCIVSNKKAVFKIAEPITEDLLLEEEDTEDFGDLKLTVEKLNFETEEIDGKCSISEMEAELVFGTEGDEETKTVKQGDMFVAGKYTITVSDLKGETSDDALYICNITDRQVKLKLLNILEETNETETKNETLNETESINEIQNETEENPEE